MPYTTWSCAVRQQLLSQLVTVWASWKREKMKANNTKASTHYQFEHTAAEQAHENTRDILLIDKIFKTGTSTDPNRKHSIININRTRLKKEGLTGCGVWGQREIEEEKEAKYIACAIMMDHFHWYKRDLCMYSKTFICSSLANVWLVLCLNEATTFYHFRKYLLNFLENVADIRNHDKTVLDIFTKTKWKQW